MTEERGGKGRGEEGEEVKGRLGDLVEVRWRVIKDLGEKEDWRRNRVSAAINTT